ncbi:MAG: type II secretion system protein M [Leptospiraceae bacterium]|nr:type II secretion system protein M [Leptospiraceae bacterium]
MLAKLEPRERLFILAGGSVLVAFLLAYMLFFLIRKRNEQRVQVHQTQAAIETAQRLKGQILSMAEPTRQVQDKNQFMGQISRLLEESSMKIRNMKDEPPEARGGFTDHPVRISLSNVELSELIRFLHTVEYKTQARVENLSIDRQLSAKELYNVSMTVTISLPNEGGDNG